MDVVFDGSMVQENLFEINNNEDQYSHHRK